MHLFCNFLQLFAFFCKKSQWPGFDCTGLVNQIWKQKICIFFKNFVKIVSSIAFFEKKMALITWVWWTKTAKKMHLICICLQKKDTTIVCFAFFAKKSVTWPWLHGFGEPKLQNNASYLLFFCKKKSVTWPRLLGSGEPKQAQKMQTKMQIRCTFCRLGSPKLSN